MKQRGYRGPVVQTSKNDYERLRYQKNGVRDYADKLLATSSMQINLLTNTLHIQSCEKSVHLAMMLNSFDAILSIRTALD